MPKVTIEFNGDFELKELNNDIKVSDGRKFIQHLVGSKEYEIILPQNAKVKAHIEESDVYKEKTIECATLKIDSKVDKEQLAKRLVELIEQEIKHVKF